MAKKKWIKGAIKNPGSFTKQAETKGLSPAQFQSRVMSNPDNYSATTRRRANLRKNLVGLGNGGMPQYAMGGNVFQQGANGQGSTSQNLVSSAGPWGAIIGAGSKMGTGIGEEVGGDAGGAIKGMFDPAAVTFNKDLSAGQRVIGSALPMLGGIWAAKAKRKAEAELKAKQDKYKRTQQAFADYEPEGMQYQSMFPNGGVVGNKQPGKIAGGITSTPNYKPISKRTYFLESKRKGAIPEDLKYSDFLKSGTKYHPKKSNSEFEEYRYDDSKKQYLKNFPQVQKSNEDVNVFNQLGTEIPEGQDVTGDIFAMGGQVPGQEVPVELEGGESFTTPQGENVNVEGPSHDNGGVPMELPEGTDIFSDRVKDPNTKKTYSDLNKNLTSKMSKYESILDDPQSTSISKKTAERMLSKLDSEQRDLFVSQERLKQDKEGYTSKYKFYRGGTAGEGYDYNSPFATGVNYADLVIPQDATFNANKQKENYGFMYDQENTQAPLFDYNSPFATGMNYADLVIPADAKFGGSRPTSKTTASSFTETVPDKMQTRQQLIQPEIDAFYAKNKPDNSSYTGNIPEDVDFADEQPLELESWMTDLNSFGVDSDIPDKKGGSQEGSGKFGNFMSNAAQYAPALYNLTQGLFGKADTLDPSDYSNIVGQAAAARLRNRKFNIDPQLEANRRAAAIGRRNITSGARTRGELLSGLSATSGQRGRADMSAYAQKQNIENQYAGEAAQMTAQLGAQEVGTQFRTQDYNARAQAAKAGMTQAGLSQLSQLAQQSKLDKYRSAADAERLALLQQMFPNYKRP